MYGSLKHNNTVIGHQEHEHGLTLVYRKSHLDLNISWYPAALPIANSHSNLLLREGESNHR